MSHVGVEVLRECRGSANDRCQHRQPLLPSGGTRPPNHQRRRLPERGPPGPPAAPPPALRRTLRYGGLWPGGASRLPVACMRILLTNDDGVTSRGLRAAKKALDSVGTVSVIAPDSNRSAV